MDSISFNTDSEQRPAPPLIDLVPELKGSLLSENLNVPVRGYVAADRLETVELVVEGETIGRVAYGMPEHAILAESPDADKFARHGFEFNLQRSKQNTAGPCCLTIRAATSDGLVREERFELLLAQADRLPVTRLSGPARRLENDGGTVPPPPILLCVDRAVIDANGNLLLQGWTVTMQPVVSVQVHLGDGGVLNARFGYQRHDVARLHEAYPNARTAGFALAAPLSEDERRVTTKLRVRTIAANGLSQEIVLPVATSSRLEQLPETFRQQQTINYFWDEANFTSRGELHVEGWAVCPVGIAEVDVHLDGESLGQAVLGLARPDVGRQFEAIPAASLAGFRFRQAIPGLTAGHHEARIVIRNVLGDEQSETKRLESVRAAPATADPHPAADEVPEFQFQVDRPRVVHGSAVEPVVIGLTVEGWVLSRSGVDEIEVRLDDVPLGLARYGLAREDVGAAYPDWENAPRSGYAFEFPPDALLRGQHLVKIIVRAMNGQEHVEHFRISVRASDDADDLVGIRQGAGDGSSRLEQILPTLLPTLVDQVYRTVLCRPADQDGLSHYVQLLSNGNIDVRGLVDVVYDSPEYLGIIRPATDEVRTAYRLLFEREPTQAETYNHVQAFRGTCGSDDEAISVFRTEGAARARLGIRPLKIEMDITNQCNIRCIMCPFSDPAVGGRKRKDLTKDTFLRWADEMFSWVAQLGLMFGTEPTLNQNLLSFVRVAKEYRVPNVYFSTNAMKLTPAMTAALIEAGLDEMNVSLDGGTKATFERIRRGAKWDTVISNLKSLRDQKAALKLSRPRLHMSYVLMQSNIRELPEFVELAAELGAVVLYWTHLVPYDGLGTVTESLGTNTDEYQQYLDRALVLARQANIHVVLPRTRQVRVDLALSRMSMQEHQPNHLAHMEKARESHGLPKRFARDEVNSCCPFPWHFIAIEPDGSVRPCGWWHAGPPMGNLYTQRFQEIWWGEPMRTLRGQLVSRQLGENCSRCPAAGMGSSDSAESFRSR